MKLICKMRGGSHSYGLNTPSSDEDFRGVFINTDVNTILGLGKFEHQVTKNETEDSAYWELRHFLNMLQRGNTQGLEMLFNQRWIFVDPLFNKLINNRLRLIDTAKVYSSLKGYIYSEQRLANGERTGKLGGKRKEQLDRLGYSPKNFVQLLRLTYCGIQFFSTRRFPVNLQDEAPMLATNLLRIKTHPEEHDKYMLNAWVDRLKNEMDAAFDKLKPADYLYFDVDLANRLLVEAYMPVLQNYAPVAQLD